MTIFDFLHEHNVVYERHDHPAVFTVAEAIEKVPPMPGIGTKNLFLRTRKGDRHFLVTVGYDKSVDLKSLAAALGEKKLGFASPERLQKYLGIAPGSVSLLAIWHDVEGAVEVIVDQAVWDAEFIKCHPQTNTSTLSIAQSEVERFIDLTKHSLAVMDVPQREA